jgi:hypothetical protein
MSRAIFSSVIGAAVLLATCYVGQTSQGQDHWNHGFGPRDNGYNGNLHDGNSYSRSRYNGGHSSSYRDSCIHGDPGRYNTRYPSYYPNPGLGGYSSGAYGYSSAPMYYGYRPVIGVPFGNSGIGINIGVGAVRPTSPYYEPLGVHRHGDTLYAPIPKQRSAW